MSTTTPTSRSTTRDDRLVRISRSLAKSASRRRYDA